MKEFIEKLIGRLEESQERYDDVSFAQLNEFGHTLDYEYAKGKRDGVEESIEIVNQLAEEHKDDIQTIDVSELLGEPEQVKQSNADRLRAMSDEELAEHFSELIRDTRRNEYLTGVGDWLLWLQSEAE